METETAAPANPTPPNLPPIFGRSTLGLGIFLLVLGMIGLLLPTLASMATDMMVATLLLAGGIFWGAYSIHDNPKNVLSWLKPLILVISGAIMLVFPAEGIETLALWLALYLLLDMSGSVTLALRQRPNAGWWWMLVNGLVSLALALMILFNWPAISAWFVGIYVSISLVMDGITLLTWQAAAKSDHNP